MPDRGNAMNAPGVNAMAFEMRPEDKQTLLQRIAPNLRNYLPAWLADTAAEALKYPTTPGRPTVIGGMVPTGPGGLPAIAPEPASVLAGEIGVRPAAQSVKYPFAMALGRLDSAGKKGPAAAANAVDNARAGQEKGDAFETWAQRFLDEFNAEQARNRFQVIPGDKKD